MELNRSIWFVRLFFWSLGIWGAFRDDDRYNCNYDAREVKRKGTNLCFFIRVMVVYMPFVLLLHAAFAVAAVAGLFALPIFLFGVIAYGWTLASIAAVVGIIWGVKKVVLRRAVRRERTQVKLVAKQPAAKAELRVPGFFEVLRKKICPSIIFLAPKKVRQ